ncbi:mycothiol synthase [Corynebacterium endometrii]|uniref:Mycothiol acetyltransferase n=1 Tax=Corynebacterium endometrii TaxID=2488819 RepID=A0A4V1CES7_9CORY|nr:mycothiol synthase [Corynebacterium endometrii]QCB29148.1 Mycothiol acetyltransferase [Corynebacterium endometrii]
MTSTKFERVTRPHGVAELAAAAQTHDGIAPLSEAFINGLTDPRLGHEHIVGTQDGEIVAVAAIDGNTVEMFVVPEARRAGIGGDLYGQLPEGSQVWAHGNLPGARALAASKGLESVRHLVVMGIGEDELSAAKVNTGLRVLNLEEAAELYGRDAVERAWLEANNEAFDWHPEQGGWDLERLHRGMEAEWFDPQDVWFLYEGDTLAGFHWTKWHGDGVGEVYVIGLATEFRGRGLGAPLLAVGLQGLKNKGARKVILYVEADNEPAVKSYKNAGFSVEEDHVVWARP